jgi:cell wall-associated NlpC family hydrolase
MFTLLRDKPRLHRLLCERIVVKNGYALVGILFLLSGCQCTDRRTSAPAEQDTITQVTVSDARSVSKPLLSPANDLTPQIIETGRTRPRDVVAYAKTLLGVPYKYASTDPAAGFDCSGFVTYVFNHFNIAVPRSSVDFTNVGNEITYSKAGPGDLILFTGTDSTLSKVGHMGIVVANKNEMLEFIHSTSGKGNGVVITPFENYYRSRFVKVIRIFPAEFF